MKYHCLSGGGDSPFQKPVTTHPCLGFGPSGQMHNCLKQMVFFPKSLAPHHQDFHWANLDKPGGRGTKCALENAKCKKHKFPERSFINHPRTFTFLLEGTKFFSSDKCQKFDKKFDSQGETIKSLEIFTNLTKIVKHLHFLPPC